MYRYISLSAVALFFIAIVTYVFYYNPQDVTFHYGSETASTLPLALILIMSFLAGALFLSAIALTIGLKFKLKEWSMARRMKLKDEHYVELLKAYDLLAIGDTEGARVILKKIVKKDPDDILSRLALAQTFYDEGKSAKAIALLEEARSEQRRSPALLVAIAKAQKKEGNLTAAHDSILLALRDNSRNITLLTQAIDLSRKLGKTGDARFLVEELLKVTPYAEQQQVSELAAEIEFEELIKHKADSPEEYRSRLIALQKSHKDFVPALLEQAEDYFALKESDKAIKFLKKGLIKTASPAILERIVSFWLETENPGAALSAAKEAASSENQKLKTSAHVLLLQLYLHLEQNDDAVHEMELIEDLLSKDHSSKHLILALKAKLESRLPGRSKINNALEKIILNETENLHFPRLTSRDKNESGTVNDPISIYTLPKEQRVASKPATSLGGIANF